MMINDWSRKQALINGSQITESLYEEKLTYGELESESKKLAGMWTLMHSSDVELKYIIQSGKAFMTRLEGDLWVL